MKLKNGKKILSRAKKMYGGISRATYNMPVVESFRRDLYGTTLKKRSKKRRRTKRRKGAKKRKRVVVYID